MSWEIRIPYRDVDDPLVAIDRAELETLGRGDAEIAGHIVAELAFTDGVRTVRDAFDYLERIGDDGRRALLDEARAKEGFAPTAAIDELERQKAGPPVPVTSVAGDPTDGEGRLLQSCGHAGCPAYPTDEHGAMIGSDFIRWYCPDHAEGHEAEMVERPAGRIVAVGGGGFEFEGRLQAEAERGKIQDEHLREDFERRQREAVAEADAIRKARERYEQATRGDPFVNPFAGAPGWGSGKT